MSLSWYTGLPVKPSRCWQWVKGLFYSGDHRAYEPRMERLAAESDVRPPWQTAPQPAVCRESMLLLESDEEYWAKRHIRFAVWVELMDRERFAWLNEMLGAAA